MKEYVVVPPSIVATPKVLGKTTAKQRGDKGGRRETHDRKAGDRQDDGCEENLGSYRLSQQMVYSAMRGNDDADLQSS